MARDGAVHGWRSRPADYSPRTIFTHDFQDPAERYSRFEPSAAAGVRAKRTKEHRATATALTGRSLGGRRTAAPRGRSTTETNGGDTEAPNDRLSSLSLRGGPPNIRSGGDRDYGGCRTYRCRASASPTTPVASPSPTPDSESSVGVVRRAIGNPEGGSDPKDPVDQPGVERYALNGTRVVECSASSTNLSDGGGSTGRAKNRAYEDWVERKRAEELRRKEERRRIESEKRAEEERATREREERERRERDNFLHWNERKRKEEATKREEIERELELERRLREVESKAVAAKAMYLRRWTRKKEENQRESQKRAEARKKREDEERERRREASAKAYLRWREASKNRPKPATQGLLPHQTAKPSYVNPKPWRSDGNDQSPRETTSTRSLSSERTRKTGTTEAAGRPEKLSSLSNEATA